MKRIITLTAIFLIGTIAIAQPKKADRLFARWDYFEAAKLYEKEAERKSTQDVNYKLGQCYQKMRKYPEAKLAYDKVNAAGSYADAGFYYKYGMVLKNNEQYTDAIEAFKTYQRMQPGDERAALYISSCEIATQEKETDLPIDVKTVSTLNTEYAAFSPVLYKDGLVFASSQKNGQHTKTYGWTGAAYPDLYYAEKSGNVLEFKEAKHFDGLVDDKYSDGPATFSKNFDTIYFNRVTKDLKGAEKRTLNIETNKIYMATRKDDKWENLQAFPYNNDSFSVATPFLTKEGSRIYFSSDMEGGYGMADIYYCYKTGSGWSKPINVGPTVNTFGNEKFPSMDADGNFYFASDGYKGYGSLDICVSKNANGNFEQAQVLKTPLNSAGDDYGITFVETGRSGYISSIRKEGQGDADIFYFSLENVDCIDYVSSYVIGYKCEPKVVEPVVIVPLDTMRPITNTDMSIEKIIDLQIFFDFDRSFIRGDEKQKIDSVYRFMQHNPGLEVEINAHADSRGTDSYNVALSTRRANTTIQYLASKRISGTRMKPKAYGESKLANSCSDEVVCSEDKHQLNRRVQFVFRKKKDQVTEIGRKGTE